MQPTITVDAIENQAMVGTIFVTDRHVLLSGSRWLKSFQAYARRAGLSFADDLFLYYHKIAGTYVLAMWLKRPGGGQRGLMKELEAMNGHPDRLVWYMTIPATDEKPEHKLKTRPRPPSRLYLMDRMVPQMVSVRKWRKEAFARARQLMREREEEQDGRQDYAKHLEHKFGYHDRTPHLVRSGMLPFALNDPRDDTARKLAEALKDPERIRDIKHRAGR